MKEVVRAACPGCQRPLNVPAAWVGKSVRCKHCGHAMLVRPVTEAAVPTAAAGVPMAAPAPTWETLPEYTPPIPAAPPGAPRAKYVSAFDARDRYRGRGQYRGPHTGGWVKAAVLGACSSWSAGWGSSGRPSSACSRRARALRGGRRARQAGGERPGRRGADAGRHRGLPAPDVGRQHPQLPVRQPPAQRGHRVRGGREPEDRTDAAVRRLAERWRVPKDQLYHLTDAPVLGEKKAEAVRPEPAPTLKKGGKDDPKDGSDEMKKGGAKEVEAKAQPEPARRHARSPPLTVGHRGDSQPVSRHVAGRTGSCSCSAGTLWRRKGSVPGPA